MCKKFEVQWAGGDEERLERLQELRLKEQEETEKRSAKGHSGEEAKGALSAGISSFRKIFRGYQEYLTREETPMPEKAVRNVIWVVFGNQQINPRGGKVININGEQLRKLYCYMQEDKSSSISR